MLQHTIRRIRQAARRCRLSPSLVVAAVAVFLALGGSAVAASGLVGTRNLAPDAVTSAKIKNGTIAAGDLNASLQAALKGNGAPGTAGASGTNGTNGLNGAAGPSGAAGANGANGPGGSNGADGHAGASGASGANGANGASGTNGANGPDGTNGVDGDAGADGTNGSDGTDGTNGTDGADGVITPLSATAGVTALPTGVPATTVVSLAVPARSYVVLAKTQLTHSGAGDTVECLLKSGTTTVDRVAMKTLPALAAIPVSMQAIVTTSTPTQLSVTCSVAVANGSADVSSLIAIPVG